MREQNDCTILTLGIFDGLHLGHKKIISRVVHTARIKRMKSCVVSIKYPLNYHSDDFEGLILPTDLRRRKILELGVDEVELLEMEKIKDMSARYFVEGYLLKRYNVAEVIVGHDFRFGKGREGDVETLKECGRIHGFDVEVIEPITLDGVRISSSLIRYLIKIGDFKSVTRFLNEPLMMEGKIVSIDKDTIILEKPDERLVMPKPGAYKSLIMLEDEWVEAQVNFPQNDGRILIELSSYGMERLKRDVRVLFRILESEVG